MKKLILLCLMISPLFAQSPLIDLMRTDQLQTPPKALPESVLSEDASAALIDLASLAAAMGEPLESMERFPATDYVRGTTASWILELTPSEGTFQVLEKEALWTAKYTPWLTRPPSAQSHSVLQARALGYLSGLGMMSEEFGQIRTNELMFATKDSATGGLRERRHSYIVNLERAYNGIPVVDSYAQASFNLDGSLHKLKGTWPKQAETGHRLSSPLTVDELKRHVATQLSAEEPNLASALDLTYQYSSTLTVEGTQIMELEVAVEVLDTPDGEKIRIPSLSLFAGSNE